MTYKRWYYRTWFISLMFAFWWFFGIPLIIGIVLLIRQRNAEIIISPTYMLEKKQKEAEINSLQAEINSLINNRNDERNKLIAEMQPAIDEKKKELDNIIASVKANENKVKELQKQIIILDDDISLQEFGLYTPVYSFANSEMYKDRLTVIRQNQKDMIKSKSAVYYPTNFTYNNSLAKGRALVNDNVKQILRSFNNECDVLINNVKFNTVDNTRKKIEKSFEQLNKMNARMEVCIRREYLKLKLDELNLAYEYALKKQEEKEAQKEERARLREEAKLQKEIEAARKVIEKEKTHYTNALSILLTQLNNDPYNQELLYKKAEIENHLAKIKKNLETIDYREANKRAGYVYVISNIGSFGENIYKIGMTRRLDPMDRVNELGDASVPFNFDVHAMIFSDDAPALETALHHAFENKKVNMINSRREFFHVTLDEIEAVVKANYDKVAEFKRIPEAEQYRETLMMRRSMHQKS